MGARWEGCAAHRGPAGGGNARSLAAAERRQGQHTGLGSRRGGEVHQPIQSLHSGAGEVGVNEVHSRARDRWAGAT